MAVDAPSAKNDHPSIHCSGVATDRGVKVETANLAVVFGVRCKATSQLSCSIGE
jgi:hypothetical protein